MTTTETQPSALPVECELAEAIKASTAGSFLHHAEPGAYSGRRVHRERTKPRPPREWFPSLGWREPGWGRAACRVRLQFACKMASHLLLTEYGAVDEDVLDAVAEVTNMIIGNVKTTLENRLGADGT